MQHDVCSATSCFVVCLVVRQPYADGCGRVHAQGEASQARVAMNMAVLVIGIGCAISGTAASVGALVGAS